VKLAIVIPGFQSSSEDWCIPAFTNLARELSRFMEVHVFALRYPHRRDHYRVGDVRVHSFGGAPVGERRVPVVSALQLWREAAREIGREHRRSPFGAILGIWATESGWLATRVGRKLGVSTIVHLAGGELVWIPRIRYGNWGRGLAGWMVRQTLAHADRLLHPSGPMLDLLRRRAPDASARGFPMSLGVDTDLFSPGVQAAGGEERPFTFVAVGSLIPVKGYGLMLRSFAQVVSTLRETGEDTVRLQIVGSGSLKVRIGRAIADLGLEGYVSLLGEVPHERLPEVYRSADCFLHTAWHEAQCMAGLEAMSCGLPWIAPPVGAFPDADWEGVKLTSGFLVEGRTAHAFARAMLRMVEMPEEERRKRGELARTRTVLRRYDLKRNTKMLALDLLLFGLGPDRVMEALGEYESRTS
jgi:glycosyltransferase involved in cell wall biosynthesis